MSTHIRLLGGLKPRPKPTASEDLTLITILGGISLDLSEATLAPTTPGLPRCRRSAVST